jgi:hypothetical protein
VRVAVVVIEREPHDLVPWPVLTLQRYEQQHRRCGRAGPGRGAAGQQNAGEAHVCGLFGCGVIYKSKEGALSMLKLTLSHGQP